MTIVSDVVTLGSCSEASCLAAQKVFTFIDPWVSFQKLWRSLRRSLGSNYLDDYLNQSVLIGTSVKFESGLAEHILSPGI